MSEPMTLLAAVAAGGALGAFFFGGLWWTTVRGLASPAPAAWFFLSLLVRTSLTALGFVVVAQGRWERVLTCLLGFFVARLVVTRLTRLPGAPPPEPVKGADYAP